MYKVNLISYAELIFRYPLYSDCGVNNSLEQLVITVWGGFGLTALRSRMRGRSALLIVGVLLLRAMDFLLRSWPVNDQLRSLDDLLLDGCSCLLQIAETMDLCE